MLHMVEIAGGYDENAEASARYDLLPAGDYRARIVDSRIEDISKNAHKGRCLALTWEIETGPHDGRLIWQRLNMWPEDMSNIDKVILIAQSQFAAIRQATGVLAPADTEELHDRACVIALGCRMDPTGRYQKQNEIRSVRAVEASLAPSRMPAPWARKTG
jgi:hypothetical protein